MAQVLAAPAPIPASPVAPTKPARIIFVVHGHYILARDQLELALHRLDLEPFILMNTSGEGQTLIEALEGRIGRDYSSDFGIVLMTPDDLGAAKAEHPEKAEPRARLHGRVYSDCDDCEGSGLPKGTGYERRSARGRHPTHSSS